MGFFADFYEALTDNTSMKNVRAKRKIREARQDEYGRKSPRNILDAMGRSPYGRLEVFDDED